MLANFLQFRGTRACLHGIMTLWRISFVSIRAFLAKGLFGTLIAIVLFFVAIAGNLVASVVGLAIAAIISVFELIFAILIRQ